MRAPRACGWQALMGADVEFKPDRPARLGRTVFSCHQPIVEVARAVTTEIPRERRRSASSLNSVESETGNLCRRVRRTRGESSATSPRLDLAASPAGGRVTSPRSAGFTGVPFRRLGAVAATLRRNLFLRSVAAMGASTKGELPGRVRPWCRVR